jgi:predicted DNA-binding transcriptional regulator YafY
MSETTSRVLALLNLLQSHRQWAGPELAERLGVTERTLRRDIERVRELGYRVEAVRGPTGGYRLEAGSQLPPLLLSDEEAVTIAIGLRVAGALGLVDGELTTQSALAKFEQVLPAALRHRVAALATHLEPQNPRTTAVPHQLIGELALASRDSERVRFSYVDARGATSARVVEPHAIVAHDRSWFLVGWDLDRDDWRTFRVDRVSALVGTRLRFTPRELPGGSAADFVAGSLRSLRARLRAEVVLKLPLAAMRDHFGPWASRATAIDEKTTSWPIDGETVEVLFGALAWVPAGVEYEVRGSPELLAFAAEASERLVRSLDRP